MSDRLVTADLLNADFFTLLGVPKRFELDQAALDERFRELQREAHPDRIAAADDAARRASMMLAAQINEAYQTLRSPLKRATYLLELAGVDVGAKAEIYHLLYQALASGMGVLVVSTDFEEIANICHRAIVFSRGLPVAELSGVELSTESLIQAASAGEVA